MKNHKFCFFFNFFAKIFTEQNLFCDILYTIVQTKFFTKKFGLFNAFLTKRKRNHNFELSAYRLIKNALFAINKMICAFYLYINLKKSGLFWIGLLEFEENRQGQFGLTTLLHLILFPWGPRHPTYRKGNYGKIRDQSYETLFWIKFTSKLAN